MSLVANQRAERVERYLRLLSQSPGQAEAYISGIIKPRLPLVVTLHDEATGKTLGPTDTLDRLTNDLQSRSVVQGDFDRVFMKAVQNQVKGLRAQAQAECGDEMGDPFGWDLVVEVIADTNRKRKSLHLPRNAAWSGPF